jgi:hypothetical protein
MGNPAPLYSVYRPSWLWKVFALLFLAVGAFFTYKFWQGPLFEQEVPKPMEMMIGVVLVAAGLGMAIHAFEARVRFTIDAIEHRTIFGVRKLPLDGIRGRREYVVRGEEGNTRHLKLEPDDDRLQTIEISKSYNFDAAFYGWFYSLPDLDAKDKEVHKDSNFGLV